jgi:excisionase family DNA binding protein
MKQPKPNETPLFQRLLSIATTAERLDCKRGKVYKLIRQGRIKKVYVDDDMRVVEASLEDFISSLPTTRSAPKRNTGRKPKPKLETVAVA